MVPGKWEEKGLKIKKVLEWYNVRGPAKHRGDMGRLERSQM